MPKPKAKPKQEMRPPVERKLKGAAAKAAKKY